MRRIGALLYRGTRLPILRSPVLPTRLPTSLVVPHQFTSRVVLWHGAAARYFSQQRSVGDEGGDTAALGKRTVRARMAP